MGVIRHADAGYDERARGRGRARRARADGRRLMPCTADRRDRASGAARARSRDRAGGARDRAGPAPDRRHDRDQAGRQRRRARRATRSASRCGSRSPRSCSRTRAIRTSRRSRSRVFVNPVIEPLDDEVVLINEGCLSVPGPARRACCATSTSGCAISTATAPSTMRSAAGSPPEPSSTRSTTSTGPLPRPRRPADAEHLGAVRPQRFRARGEFETQRARALVETGGRLYDRVPVRARVARRRAGRGRRPGRGRGRADRRRSTPASPSRPPSATRLAGLTLPGLRQRALTRLSPGAARAHPARARELLDLARARCTRSPPGSIPTPTSASRARPSPRWRSPGSPRSASSTTSTTTATARRTTTRTRWAGR